MQDKKLLVLSAPVGTRSGYGARSRDIAIALIKSDKYDVRIVPTPWGHTPNDALISDDENHKLIIDRLAMKVERQPDIFIQVTIPSEFLPNNKPLGKINIGITAGIETNICRHEWLFGCNRMDLVLTSSEHSKRVLTETKYTADNGSILKTVVPIEVLFEGVDVNIYKKTSELNKTVVQELSDIKEDFCFLFVGHWLQGNMGQDRKDVGMMIKTFCDTFRNKPPRTRPALILKTSGATFSETDKHDIQTKLWAILEPYGGKRPNVYLLHGDLTDDEMNSLYNHPKVKSMISFTKGEGFGRPLLEFMTTGKPIIASGWSGQLDFLNPSYNELLAGELTPVHPSAVNEWIIKESKWFTVNYPQAAQTLMDVFKNYKDKKETSKNNINEAKDKFSLDKMQDKLVEHIENLWESKQDTYLPPIKKLGSSVKSIKLPKLKKL